MICQAIYAATLILPIPRCVPGKGLSRDKPGEGRLLIISFIADWFKKRRVMNGLSGERDCKLSLHPKCVLNALIIWFKGKVCRGTDLGNGVSYIQGLSPFRFTECNYFKTSSHTKVCPLTDLIPIV